ncbi:MAG TPA: SNF2-related protein [Streptosporangiaceae bacterium]|nr:SNF2-related protein [Streptosporangiaceae bacterium]
MLVIHGTWAYGALSLWAEDSTGPPAAVPRPGRPSRAPRPHPFAGDVETLAEAVAELAGPAADLALKAIEDELTLLLPARADGPLASPALIREPGAEPPRAPARPALSPWRVPALTFEAATGLDLLGALGDPGATMPPPAMPSAALGGSVPYLAALARHAGDLAARGRVVPTLEAGADGSYAARWRPVLTGADAQRAQDLAAAMPPLCRAVMGAREPSAVIVIDALDALADAAARARLGREPGFGLLPARRGRRPARVPVAERWAEALTGADTQVSVVTAKDDAEAAQLAAELAQWRAAAQVPVGPVRTCFRLIEPAEPEPAEPEPAEPESAGTAEAAGSGEAPQAAAPDESALVGPDAADRAPWTVEFALQATDDPSLLLSAADIWSGSTAGGWAAAGIRHPEEDLLTGLGTASRLFDELDLALHEPAPVAVTLDTEGAFRFLQQTGPLLSGAGFGVLLPDWVRKARLGLKLTTRTRRSSSGAASATESMFGLHDLVDFRYDLAVGDESLDPAELEELARLKVPLVRLRGQWVELDDRHLQAALKFLQRKQSGTMTVAEALQEGLGLAAEDDLPVAGVVADGWLGDLLSGQAESRLEPVPTPASFHGELRPYQERGLAWLSFLGNLGLGAVLADSMGLGKTVQVLGLVASQHEVAGEDAKAGPTLLVCPMSLVGNWEREAERFTPDLRVHVHHGADRLRGEELSAALGGADLVITTYGLAARDQEELSQVPWARVVCDEAQNIKNAATRQARAVRALPAASRIALTGTPVENRLADLWSIMEFTRPGLLGPAERFRTKFAVPIERNGDEEAAERLRRITGPFILRREKTDKSIISDLPDKLEMKVWCNLTPEQASLYQATVSDMMAKIEAADEGIERRGLVLATMAKLKQVCNHPAHLLGDGSRLDGRSGKLARLEEICDEVVAEGNKALCFTQYAEFGRMLQPYLATRLGCPVPYLHGGTAKKQRDAMVAEFQAGTEPAVFLLSLKAGGTGLNLTAANHVIHVDRWWNPAVEDQATDRAFRIGQRKDVQVRKFVCVGTLEERIDAMIEEKKALAQRIVGTGEGWLADLSVADLRQVIALSPEAVSESS